ERDPVKGACGRQRTRKRVDRDVALDHRRRRLLANVDLLEARARTRIENPADVRKLAGYDVAQLARDELDLTPIVLVDLEDVLAKLRRAGRDTRQGVIDRRQ